MVTAASPSNRRLRLLAALLEKTGVKTGVERIPLRGGDRTRAPLSSGQRRLWFLDRVSPGNPVYNVPTCFRLRGPLNTRAFGGALSEIVRRHEILRTTFEVENNEPAQVISPGLHISMNVVDLSAAGSLAWAQAEKLALEEARQPFDLERGPLLRARLFRIAADDHLALISMHHIVCDGWSIGVLLRELAGTYEALVQGAAANIPEPPVQYGDFAAWERERIARGVLDSQVAYWRRRLAGAPQGIELPADRARPQQPSFRGAIVRRTVEAGAAGAVRELARMGNATPFALLLAAYAAFLHRYTRQADIVVGCPIANRARPELQNLIGFFPNTLPLRLDLEGDPSFADLVHRVQGTVREGFANAEAPLELVSNGRGSLFEVAFLYEQGAPPSMRFGDLEVTPVDLDLGTAKCDLTLTAAGGAAGLSLALEYSTDLFDEVTARRMIEHFATLLLAAAEAPSMRLSELPLISRDEELRIVEAHNDARRPFPNSMAAHELFERQVELRPDAPALLFRGATVTYAQLNERANGIARRLRRSGFGVDALAAIALKRSPEMIAAMLGVLKAGGAYLPLSLDHPAERIAFLLEDARPAMLLTTEQDRATLPPAALRLPWKDVSAREAEAEYAGNLPRAAGPLDLAYVIYTSGSTGRPKGVLVEHRGLCNLAAEQQRFFRIGPGARILQFAAPTFDASVWEIFMALASGACLSFGDGETFTPEELARVLRRDRITTVTLPPSILRLLRRPDFPDLHTVISAGESCSEALACEWSRDCAFFNAYGPTEATVCATIARYQPGCRLTIGRPIGNTRVYVLDKQLKPVPDGVPGELYIGGAGVARGYLNRPELNAASFIADPFAPGGRLYKTGDLARRLANGEIEFLGRADSQIKIRGHRIEPGEIEARLEEHPQILQAAVVVRQESGREPQLAAYFVARETAPDNAALRAFVSAALPAYMTPDVFVRLEALPVNSSGKIDRQVLARLAPAAERPRLAPRDGLERDLARVWQDVLGVREVSATDDFFELGGNSLLTVNLMRAIREATGCDLPLSAIYQASTVEQMALVIRGLKEQRVSGARVVTLQPHGARRPLVLIHPAGGSVICYHDLARKLAPDQPVYGIEPPDEQDLGDTIPSMAARCIEALKAASVGGPYRLGGWSSGGLIAYEMARQLEGAGERVELVLLIDSWATVPEPAADDDVQLLVEVVRTMAGARGLKHPIRAKALRALPEPARIAVVAAQFGGEAAEREIHATLRRFRVNMRAARAYAAGPYHGRVVLFRPPGMFRSDDRGWRRAAAHLEVRRAAGRHETLLFGRHAAELAREIKACLDGSAREEMDV